MPVAPGPHLHDIVGLSRSAVGSGLAQLRLWDIFPASDLLSHAQPRCQGDGSLYVEMRFHFPAYPRAAESPSALPRPPRHAGVTLNAPAAGGALWTRLRARVSLSSRSSRVSLAAMPSHHPGNAPGQRDAPRPLQALPTLSQCGLGASLSPVTPHNLRGCTHPSNQGPPIARQGWGAIRAPGRGKVGKISKHRKTERKRKAKRKAK